MKNEVLKQRMMEMIERLKMEVGNVADSDFIITSRVEDFDMSSNEVWELEANKSFPRDVFCHFCKKQMVMSNGAFAEYEKLEKKPGVLCIHCLKDGIKKK